ncbi:MAG: SpoVG family protein [Clostridia bacterium]|nr:SpoVG family protein [Clostridia bacterium]
MVKNAKNEMETGSGADVKREPIDNSENLVAAQQNSSIEIKVTSIALQNEDNLLARTNLLLNDCFAVRGVKIVNGKHGAFVSMPSYQALGRFVEVCFPTTSEFRQKLNDTVIEAYQQTLAQGQKAMDQAKQSTVEEKSAEMESSGPFAGEEQEHAMNMSM